MTTAADLVKYAGANTPYTIVVSGRIAVDDMVTVVANKTIVGAGSTAEITGGGLQLGSTTRPGNNVIIRNIRFSDASDDSISVTNKAHHVWIDHNEFLPGYDGSLDIKRQSTFVTVSWNHFHGTDKTMLLGHSDTYTADVGYLKVTYHHNLLRRLQPAPSPGPVRRPGARLQQLLPQHRPVRDRVHRERRRAGRGQLLRERAVPVLLDRRLRRQRPGRLVQRSNAFANSGTCEAGGAVTEPSTYYAYRLDPASAVPSLVTAGAGVGRI